MAQDLITTPFKPEVPEFEVAAGTTLIDVIHAGKIPMAVWDNLVVSVNGSEIMQEFWDTTVLYEEDQIALYVIPMGGGDSKSILRLVATIAVIAAAYIFAPYLAPYLTNAAWGLQAAQAGIAIVGMLAVNALIPPPSPNMSSSAGSRGEAFFFSGQSNSMRPYEIIPIVYGAYKMVPNLLTVPHILNAGTKSIFTGLYDWGLGQVAVSDIRAGDTPIDVFDGEVRTLQKVPHWVDEKYPELGFQPLDLQLVNYAVKSEGLSVGLGKAGDKGQFTTAKESGSALIEFQFPSGVVEFTDRGDEKLHSVKFGMDYRKSGTNPETGQPYPWEALPKGSIAYTGDHLFVSGLTPGGITDPELGGDLGVKFEVSDYDVMANEFNKLLVTVTFDQPVTWTVGQVPASCLDPTNPWNKDIRVFQFANDDRSFNPILGNALELPVKIERKPTNPNNYPVDADGVMEITKGLKYQFQVWHSWMAIGGLRAVHISCFINQSDFKAGNGTPWPSKVTRSQNWWWRGFGNPPPPDYDIPLKEGEKPEDKPVTAPENFNPDPGKETYLAVEEWRLGALIGWTAMDGVSAILMVRGVERAVSKEDIKNLKGSLMKTGPLWNEGARFRRTAYYSIRGGIEPLMVST